MKEIKAYVRPELLVAIVAGLEEAGVRDITVIPVEAIGRMADYEKDRSHLWRKYAEKYSKIAKLEIVCGDDEYEAFTDIIQRKGQTGESGDGRIFVADIVAATNIRTGEHGKAAL